MSINHQLPLLLALGALAAVLLRKLTPLAGIAGASVGWLVYLGAGYAGIAVMALFLFRELLHPRGNTIEKLNYPLRKKTKAGELRARFWQMPVLQD